MFKHEERYQVRCRECGKVLAVREGNLVTSFMKHRSRKKELRIRLVVGQNLYIDCDQCGQSNVITGA